LKKLTSILLGLIIFVLLITGLTACDGYYIVHFNANGGTPVESVRGKGINHPVYIEEEPITTREGYIFDGWFMEETYIEGRFIPSKKTREIRIEFPYESKHSHGYTVTFYAKWSKT